MAAFLLMIFVCFSCICSIRMDTCVEKSPCTCEFSNGTGIDLTPAAQTTFYTTQIYEVNENDTKYSLSLYYFNPCKNLPFNVTTLNDEDTCKNDIAICRHINTLSKNDSVFDMINGPYEKLGVNGNKSSFSADGLSIVYENEPSKVTVLLKCVESKNDFRVDSLENPDDVILAFYSRDACLKQLEEPGRSTGSTLLIIFFSVVIFYLVLGICTKKFLMGAQGVEVIPNLAFWSDLPNLVKDGWAFTRNGFKLPARGPGPVTTPDPNSYDSI